MEILFIFLLTENQIGFNLPAMIRIYIEKMERERKRLGLSKAEIERLVKLKQSAYSKILTRRSTSISTLNRIAEALYLDPKDLLTS